MREADRSFVVMAAFLATILGAYGVIAGRVAPAPEAILDHLASTPLHKSFYGASIDAPGESETSNDEPHLLGIVPVVSTPQRTALAEGAAILLNYYVFDSDDAAQARFDEIFAQAQEPNRRVKRLDVQIAWAHACGFASQHFCYVVVGPVLIEATSRIMTFGLDDRPRLRELVELALDHLKDAQPTGLGL